MRDQMIGAEHFDAMKPAACFINVCRGSMVDEPPPSRARAPARRPRGLLAAERRSSLMGGFAADAEAIQSPWSAGSCAARH